MQTDRPHVSVLIEEAMHHEDYQDVSVSRGYSLPSRWAYMLQEYGACSGIFCLPAAGCTTIVEVPIDWGTAEALPALSQRREASAVPPHERQVARVIPQQPPPKPGHPLLGRGTLMLLNQLLQQEPGLPGPPPPSSTSESDEVEWWDDDDDDAAEGGAAGGAAGGVSGDGRGGVYTEGD